MEFVEHTLENGLQIVAECNPRAHSLAIGFFVRAGSRDENDTISGVSHFLEHMVFKGTPRRTAEDVNREFDELGAYYNAFTSEEFTVYYSAVLPEFQTDVLDLWADILRPSLRDEDFKTEKEVILEEINMYDDMPPFRADDECRARFYGSHPLARSVLGSVESIRALHVDAMREYFRRRYSPGNIKIVACGKVDFDRLVSEAEKRCGHWEPVETDRLLEAPDTACGEERLVRAAATQQYVVQWSQAPPAGSELRYAAHLAANMIGDSSGSRLFWEFVDSGRAESASMGYHENEDTGVFGLYMNCDTDRLDENLERCDALLEALRRDGFTNDEIERAKNKVAARIVLGSERPQNRLFGVGLEWMLTGRYHSVENDLEIVRSITLDDVHRVLEEYPPDRYMRVVIGPPKPGDASA
ncbi:MAG: insulinase family protein [Planctomycetota bacterium]|nr:MAG: insulinase family protein [Planctomycetota bacterium]